MIFSWFYTHNFPINNINSIDVIFTQLPHQSWINNIIVITHYNNSIETETLNDLIRTTGTFLPTWFRSCQYHKGRWNIIWVFVKATRRRSSRLVCLTDGNGVIGCSGIRWSTLMSFFVEGKIIGFPVRVTSLYGESNLCWITST